MGLASTSTALKAAIAASISMVAVTTVAVAARNRAAARALAPALAPATPAPSPPPAQAEVAEVAPPSHGKDIELAGEVFTVRHVVDTTQGNMFASSFLAPASWRETTAVKWDKGNDINPVIVTLSVENPANAEAYYLYPNWAWFTLRPDGPMFKKGQYYGGAYKGDPLAPPDAIVAFVKSLRGKEEQFHIVGSQQLPGLPSTLKVHYSDHDQGIALKVGYTLQGHPVEEEFYAVAYRSDVPESHSGGRLVQINWGLGSPNSFRAPAGTLDKRRPIFETIRRSGRPNPEWNARVVSFYKAKSEAFTQGYDKFYRGLAASRRRSEAIKAKSDAFLANIDRGLAASRASSAAPRGAAAEPEEGRGSAEKFDDYLRGVDTVVDPNLGTSQHSNTEQYHWTDGNGSYRNTNDGTYDPNAHESGDWKRMQEAK